MPHAGSGPPSVFALARRTPGPPLDPGRGAPGANGPGAGGPAPGGPAAGREADSPPGAKQGPKAQQEGRESGGERRDDGTWQAKIRTMNTIIGRPNKVATDHDFFIPTSTCRWISNVNISRYKYESLHSRIVRQLPPQQWCKVYSGTVALRLFNPPAWLPGPKLCARSSKWGVHFGLTQNGRKGQGHVG